MIGDVCGHGPDEAALGVCLRIAWRTLVLAGQADDQVLDTLQELLIHERHREGIFTTLCMATIAPDQSSAAVYIAGPPVADPDRRRRPAAAASGSGRAAAGRG